MSVHRRGQSWFVRYRDAAGKAHNKHFGPGKSGKKLAEEFDLEVKLAKKKKREVVLLGKSEMKLDELVELYLRDYRLSVKSSGSIYNLTMLFKNKILPNLPAKPVDALKYEDFLNMIEKFPDLSQATKNRYFAYIRAVINWGVRHEYVTQNPVKNWKLRKEQPRRFVLSQKDLYQLLEHSPEHLKLAILVTYNLGLRPGLSELFALKWSDVDFERQEVHVFATKTMRSRRIPIPDSFVGTLKKSKLLAKTPYVIEYRGRQVKRLSQCLGTALKKAGISKEFRLYDLRHMYATYMLNQGADLAAVSYMLGHSDTSLTANTYYQAMAQEKVRAANLLPTLHADGDPEEKFRKRQERRGEAKEEAKNKKSKVTSLGYLYKK